jgi:hypothetical protein
MPNVTATYGKVTDSPLRYTALSCAVTTAHTVMTCLTTQGTGTGLVWRVSVEGQASQTLLTQTTDYAPPVTAQFSGVGASLAQTYGYQAVIISGESIRSGPMRLVHYFV